MSEPQPFTSDAPLFYNVGIWGERGYAIPNFGPNQATVNQTIEEMTTEGGKRLSAIMHHEDTDRSDPPSVNTIVRMVTLMNRARVLLLGRMVPENVQKFESQKVKSPRRPFKVFPCPFFKVRNRLMQKFGETVFASLAELMQSTEVAISYDITEKLATSAISYIQRFQTMLAMEYFNLPQPEAKSPTLDLMTQLAKYTPTAYGFASADVLDKTGTISWPQEYDLGILAEGILVPTLPAGLGPYPWPDTMTDSSVLNSLGQVTTQVKSSLPPFPTNPVFRV
jgi:hypothetical protein